MNCKKIEFPTTIRVLPPTVDVPALRNDQQAQESAHAHE